MLGAKWLQIMAFVLAGFPTTTTFTFLSAYWFKACPQPLKICPFYPNKSDLSIPGPLGLAPTKIATQHPVNPSLQSVAPFKFEIKGKELSFNSIKTPSKALAAQGISSKVKSTGWWGPNILPYPIMKTKAYPIFPAPPVTVTLMGVFNS